MGSTKQEQLIVLYRSQLQTCTDAIQSHEARIVELQEAIVRRKREANDIREKISDVEQGMYTAR